MAPWAANFKRNRPANTAAAAGDHGNFAVKPEIGVAFRLAQSETPRFQGMKSFWAFSSAFVRVSPLATLITSSRMSSPMRSMVALA